MAALIFRDHSNVAQCCCCLLASLAVINLVLKSRYFLIIFAMPSRKQLAVKAGKPKSRNKKLATNLRLAKRWNKEIVNVEPPPRPMPNLAFMDDTPQHSASFRPTKLFCRDPGLENTDNEACSSMAASVTVSLDTCNVLDSCSDNMSDVQAGLGLAVNTTDDTIDDSVISKKSQRIRNFHPRRRVKD